MTGGVDEVELVHLSVIRFVEHADCLALDRDAALALDVHRVEHLFLEVSCSDRSRLFKDAVG